MTFIRLNSILIAAYFMVWIVGDVTHVLLGQPVASIGEAIGTSVLCTSPIVAGFLNWKLKLKCLGESSEDRGCAVVFGLLFVPVLVLLLIWTIGVWFHFSIGGQ